MKREIDYSYSTTFCDLVISKGNNIPRSISNAESHNSSFNQYAVAFNDEFIDVSVGSTEKADISYKGRDNNSKLIVT